MYQRNPLQYYIQISYYLNRAGKFILDRLSVLTAGLFFTGFVASLKH